MCGLAGYLTDHIADREASEQVAMRMADALRHRGPDDTGTWLDPAAGLALAHQRLSILDLSPAGHQPMHSACGRFVIAYNGEIYNFREVRRDLEASGSAPNWRGHSDTEVLLAAISAWGVERALQACHGMFALALWDKATRSLVLARDRMGEKPLYYGWQGRTFLFGSELKAFRPHPAFRGQVNRGAISLLLRYNYIPAPFSIYDGIHKLPAGTFLRISRGVEHSVPQAYWSLGDVAVRGQEAPFKGDETAAVDELETRLARAVQAQCVADVPLGALLSGGIDSSAVVALMQANSRHKVRTFTIGFSESAYDESRHAAAVAAHLGTDHTELILTPEDALRLVPDVPRIYDEPFADSSQLPTQLVMRLARQHVTVALSGDGGDELFGGYNRYRLAPALWRSLGWFPQSLRRRLGQALLRVPADKWDGVLGPLAYRLGVAQVGDKVQKLGKRMGAVTIDELFFSFLSEWDNSRQVVLRGNEPRSLLSEQASWPPLSDPMARMMAVDGLTYLPDDILVKVDRAAMATSLETRAPFLDLNVIEYAWQLPGHLKIRGSQGKWALRKLLERYIPRQLIDRPKMGFGIPLDRWLRGPLREWGEALLDSSTLRQQGYLDSTVVRQVWRAHLEDGRSFGYRLWSVLMFQAWVKEHGSATASNIIEVRK